MWRLSAYNWRKRCYHPQNGNLTANNIKNSDRNAIKANSISPTADTLVLIKSIFSGITNEKRWTESKFSLK